MNYPASLPCPTWEYTQQTTLHPQRAQFDCGWARQRREWGFDNTQIQLNFVMDTSAFDRWARWMNANGYDWYMIYLDDYGSGQQLTEVRNISAATWRYAAFDVVYVSVSAEIKNG